ncbi:helix-turn-helix transcriptional regulator [Panacibacter sp. DH6]|uniref:Helix-turn-helix transcriptional regulator n=2 Tax=Panacibacter microcysteis TaxID=2793269 RepID=A0A931GTW4_9BACT|nr:helix-turn-helix transcriptional regulator [Panacibacter microcysteis]
MDLSRMDIKLKVGQRVRELRKQRELSQEGLAYKAEVDRTYVTDIENGRRNVSLEIMERLINALDVSITEFFNTKEFRK